MHYIVEEIEFDFEDSQGLSTKKNNSLLQKMQSVYGGLTQSMQTQKMS